MYNIYQGYDTPELIQAISSEPKLNLLLKEISHTFKLQAFAVQTDHHKSEFSVSNVKSLSLCDMYGRHTADIFIDEIPSTCIHEESVLEYEYCFYTEDTNKLRGKNTKDRHTYRSKKLSSLIASLKRNNVVTDPHKNIQGKYKTIITGSLDIMKHTITKNVSHKHEIIREIDGDFIHHLIKTFFDKDAKMPEFDETTVLELLKKLDKIEKTRADLTDEIFELFKDEAYAITFHDVTKDYSVTKIKFPSKPKVAVGRWGYEMECASTVIESCRVKSIRQSFPELAVYLTILSESQSSRFSDKYKHRENNDSWYVKWDDFYDKVLGVCNDQRTAWHRNKRYEELTLLIPCAVI